ncbi:hypothetical protein DPM19_18175 [Actinomadura craniellae]|uniref:Uncharacterized protein n=1 Tax=Actinomadura craniellae TaxID=2231787 RepID=A0A365H3L0_9ACTN|nr:hypothetical protein [Actinomadura craniellae]RAY13606.1 hypothetical protein DPM19_18175 [Actinomadura craniellae]
MAPTNPTALADQLSAATRHARATVTAVADQIPGGALTDGALIPWIREQIEALLTALFAGAGHVCPHLNHLGSAPQPAIAAAWAPERLTCNTCAPTLLAAPGDTTCDRCSRPTPALHVGAVAAGLIIFHFALCPDCATEIGIPTPAAPDRP